MSRRVFRLFLIVLFIAVFSGSVHAIEGFPGSTWGELRWELPKDGENNLILRGWIEQGVDWTKWGNLRLNTYVTVRYVLDSEKNDFNNSIGPGVGLAFSLIDKRGDQLKAGAEYIWDRFLESDRTEEKAVVFMKWYGWWDLKKK
jgi:hypothetical protein